MAMKRAYSDKLVLNLSTVFALLLTLQKNTKLPILKDFLHQVQDLKSSLLILHFLLDSST